MGSDAEPKESIEMEGKSAQQEQRIPRILKLCIHYRGRYPGDPEFVRPNWYREFEISDKTILEQLATIILQILGWEEDHLYEFKIKDRSHVHFGNDDDYFVDAKEACVSCVIPMHLIDLNRKDPFEFIFDFGELHAFRLTVVAIYPFTLRRSSIPYVLSYRGKNVLQYPGVLLPAPLGVSNLQ